MGTEVSTGDIGIERIPENYRGLAKEIQDLRQKCINDRDSVLSGPAKKEECKRKLDRLEKSFYRNGKLSLDQFIADFEQNSNLAMLSQKYLGLPDVVMLPGGKELFFGNPRKTALERMDTAKISGGKIPTITTRGTRSQERRIDFSDDYKKIKQLSSSNEAKKQKELLDIAKDIYPSAEGSEKTDLEGKMEHAYVVIANDCLAEKDFDDARENYENAQKFNATPNQYQENIEITYEKEGDYNKDEGKFEKSEISYKEAQKIKKANNENYYNNKLGELYLVAGDTEAVKVTDESLIQKGLASLGISESPLVSAVKWYKCAINDRMSQKGLAMGRIVDLYKKVAEFCLDKEDIKAARRAYSEAKNHYNSYVSKGISVSSGTSTWVTNFETDIKNKEKEIADAKKEDAKAKREGKKLPSLWSFFGF